MNNVQNLLRSFFEFLCQMPAHGMISHTGVLCVAKVPLKKVGPLNLKVVGNSVSYLAGKTMKYHQSFFL